MRKGDRVKARTINNSKRTFGGNRIRIHRNISQSNVLNISTGNSICATESDRNITGYCLSDVKIHSDVIRNLRCAKYHRD